MIGETSTGESPAREGLAREGLATFADFARRHALKAFTETHDPIAIATFVMRQKRLSGLKAQAKGTAQRWANRSSSLQAKGTAGLDGGARGLARMLEEDGVHSRGIQYGRLWSFADIDIAVPHVSSAGVVEIEARPDPRAVADLPCTDSDDPKALRHVGGEAGGVAMLAAMADLAEVVGQERDDLAAVSFTPLGPRCHGRAELIRRRGWGVEEERHGVHLRVANHLLALYEPCLQGRSERKIQVAVPDRRSATLRAAGGLKAQKSRARLAALLASSGVPELAAGIASWDGAASDGAAEGVRR